MTSLESRLGTAKARLAGKTTIVTGAGSDAGEIGIGKAIALLFAREGAQVAVVDWHRERAEQTCTDIRNLGGDAIALAANVTNKSDCERAIEKTLERFGKLDILVNNVGIAGGAPGAPYDEDAWQHVLDTNIKSAMLMCNLSLPALCRNGGAIVNTASIAGIRAMSGTAYGPSKAALIMYTREVALSYGRQGVRANAVAPGHIDSPKISALFTPEMRDARRKVAPLGNTIDADVWDIAFATLFLASDEARFITGVCLPVDGGVSEIGALAAQHLINS